MSNKYVQVADFTTGVVSYTTVEKGQQLTNNKLELNGPSIRIDDSTSCRLVDDPCYKPTDDGQWLQQTCRHKHNED